MKVSFFVALLLVLVVYDAKAKVFTKCGLTKELLNNTFDRSMVGNWVCMVESESAKNTSKMTKKADGSKAVGLFQIRDKGWCTWEKAGGKCNIQCEKLLDDDIRDDSICAKKIQAEAGFRAWEGWMRSCYRRQLPFPPC